jgi:uncharacterized protein (UPF0335 family)
MNAHVPEINYLKQIHSYIEKIDALKKQLDAIQGEIQDMRKEYEHEGVARAKKYEEDMKQHMYLEQIVKDMADARKQEDALRSQLEREIEQAFETYMANGYLAEVVESIMKYQKNSNLTVHAGKDMAKVAKLKDFNSAEDGVLRVETPEKDYVLDRDVLKKEVTDMLLTSVVSSYA